MRDPLPGAQDALTGTSGMQTAGSNVVDWLLSSPWQSVTILWVLEIQALGPYVSSIVVYVH